MPLRSQYFMVIKRLGITLGFIVVFIALALLYFHYDENFHSVIPGQVYRSAELTPNELIEKIHANHIKSVINLRGENKSDDWYQSEFQTLQALQIPLYNVRLSSYDLPSQALLLQLIDTIKSAPKPTLIHCASGADRTGLASAIVILLSNGSIDEAKNQTSWRYGAIRPNSAGKLFFENYTQWLTDHQIKVSTSKTFKSFTEDVKKS